jgi:hypothetical protein
MAERDTKGIPSIPDVPAVLGQVDLYRILDPLKRIIDIRQGRFDVLDKWITAQDLIDAGLTTKGAIEAPVPIVSPIAQYNFSLTGEVAGPVTIMGTGNPVIMKNVLIDLPNVTEISGGAPDTDFEALPRGPLFGYLNT